jgi:hypothetical protein
MTPLRQNNMYRTLYVVWSKLIITEIFPYVTIIVLNIIIIGKVISASSFRKQVPTSFNERRKNENFDVLSFLKFYNYLNFR